MECTTGLCRLSGDVQLLLPMLAQSLLSLLGSVPFLFPILAAVVGWSAAAVGVLLAHSLPIRRGWGEAPPSPGIPLLGPVPACTDCGETHSFSSLPALATSGGRCTSCDAPLPLDRPALEIGSALTSFVLAAALGPTTHCLGILVLGWALLVAAWIDWRTMEIPDFLTVPICFVGLMASPFDPDVASRVLGAGMGAGFVLGTFALVSRVMDVDHQSYGDVALCGAIGAWVGACGAIPAVLLAALVHGSYAGYLRTKGITWVPMGPGIAVGGLIAAATGLGL